MESDLNIEKELYRQKAIDYTPDSPINRSGDNVDSNISAISLSKPSSTERLNEKIIKQLESHNNFLILENKRIKAKIKHIHHAPSLVDKMTQTDAVSDPNPLTNLSPVKSTTELDIIPPSLVKKVLSYMNNSYDSTSATTSLEERIIASQQDLISDLKYRTDNNTTKYDTCSKDLTLLQAKIAKQEEYIKNLHTSHQRKLNALRMESDSLQSKLKQRTGHLEDEFHSKIKELHDKEKKTNQKYEAARRENTKFSNYIHYLKTILNNNLIAYKSECNSTSPVDKIEYPPTKELQGEDELLALLIKHYPKQDNGLGDYLNLTKAIFKLMSKPNIKSDTSSNTHYNTNNTQQLNNTCLINMYLFNLYNCIQCVYSDYTEFHYELLTSYNRIIHQLDTKCKNTISEYNQFSVELVKEKELAIVLKQQAISLYQQIFNRLNTLFIDISNTATNSEEYDYLHACKYIIQYISSVDQFYMNILDSQSIRYNTLRTEYSKNIQELEHKHNIEIQHKESQLKQFSVRMDNLLTLANKLKKKD